MIARNLVAQLRLGIRQRRRIRPVNIPIDRNLRPHQQSHAVRQTNLILVVRIVSEADEVASQIFHPPEKSLRIFRAEGAALAKRRLLVHRNAAQKNGLAVQQNVRSLHFDRAKTNLIVDCVRCRC